MKLIPNSYNDERKVTREERWLKLTSRPNMLRGRSKYRGVHCESKKRVRPWKASLTFDGRVYFGGCFDTEEEAAQAWNELALKIIGPLAEQRLNVIDC